MTTIFTLWEARRGGALTNAQHRQGTWEAEHLEEQGNEKPGAV